MSPPALLVREPKAPPGARFPFSPSTTKGPNSPIHQSNCISWGGGPTDAESTRTRWITTPSREREAASLPRDDPRTYGVDPPSPVPGRQDPSEVTNKS